MESCRGEVMAAAMMFHDHVWDSDMAVGWAMVDGQRLAVEMGFYLVVFEKDSKQVYEIMQGEKDELSDLSMLIVNALED